MKFENLENIRNFQCKNIIKLSYYAKLLMAIINKTAQLYPDSFFHYEKFLKDMDSVNINKNNDYSFWRKNVYKIVEKK